MKNQAVVSVCGVRGECGRRRGGTHDVSQCAMMVNWEKGPWDTRLRRRFDFERSTWTGEALVLIRYGDTVAHYNVFCSANVLSFPSACTGALSHSGCALFPSRSTVGLLTLAAAICHQL